MKPIARRVLRAAFFFKELSARLLGRESIVTRLWLNFMLWVVRRSTLPDTQQRPKQPD